MKKSIITLAAFMGLGYATQAHANYVPQSTAWNQISSTAPTSTSNGTEVHNSGPRLTETRSWVWVGDGTPTTPSIQLDFAVSLGTVFIGRPQFGGRCVSGAYGGFESSLMYGNDAHNFNVYNAVSDPNGIPGMSARTLTAHLIEDLPPSQAPFETAYVGASTNASYTVGGYANSSTNQLTGFSLIQP